MDPYQQNWVNVASVTHWNDCCRGRDCNFLGGSSSGCFDDGGRPRRFGKDSIELIGSDLKGQCRF